MGRKLLVGGLLAMVAASLSARSVDPRRQSASQNETWPYAPAEIQAFVRDAVADRLKADNIPDLDLRYGRNRSVSIRREITKNHMRLNDDALPRIEGFSLSLRTTAELQAESDRANSSPMFIIVNSVNVTGDTGIIQLGTDILLPTNSRAGKLCCCVADGTFARSTTGWRFKSWSNLVCS